MSKLRTSVDAFVKSEGVHARLDHLTPMEINGIRPLLSHALDQMLRIQTVSIDFQIVYLLNNKTDVDVYFSYIWELFVNFITIVFHYCLNFYGIVIIIYIFYIWYFIYELVSVSFCRQVQGKLIPSTAVEVYKENNIYYLSVILLMLLWYCKDREIWIFL